MPGSCKHIMKEMIRLNNCRTMGTMKVPSIFTNAQSFFYTDFDYSVMDNCKIPTKNIYALASNSNGH